MTGETGLIVALLRRTQGSVLAFLVKDLRASLLSPRIGAVSSAVAGATLIVAWYLGTAAVSASARGADLASRHLWEKGADGALAGLGYLVPLIIPALPAFLVQQNLKADRKAGLLAQALTKPFVSGFIAIGKLLGLTAAVSVPVALLSLASIFLIQLIVGQPVDASLAIGFLGTNLLLVALYVVLAFVFGMGKNPENVGTLSLLAFIGFNLLRPTALELLGQIVGALSVGRIVSFGFAWTDPLTFTGIHHGLLARALPGTLGFLSGPGEPMLSALPWSAVAWLAGLAALYVYFLHRLPTR